MADYLCGPQFTLLFRARRKQHQAICRGLFLISVNCARAINFDRREDRDDAAGAAMLAAIKRIGKFNPRKSGNAFGYFTKMILRDILRERRRQQAIASRERQLTHCG